MNYGKNKASKKQKEITSKATMQSKRDRRKALQSFFIMPASYCHRLYHCRVCVPEEDY